MKASVTRRRARLASQAAERRKARFERDAQLRSTARQMALRFGNQLKAKAPSPSSVEIAAVPAAGVAPAKAIASAYATNTHPHLGQPVQRRDWAMPLVGAVAAALAALFVVRPVWLSMALTPAVPVTSVAGSAEAARPLDLRSVPVIVPLQASLTVSAVETQDVAGAAESGAGSSPTPGSITIALQGPPDAVSGATAPPPLQMGLAPGDAPAGPLRELAAREGGGTEEETAAAAQCQWEKPEKQTGTVAPVAGETPEAFGKALAAAAVRQTHDFGVYTDKYRTLAFPMGDVPKLYGVCTDVIIRAYRVLGVDLQARVHAAQLGSGDASIAHRRTFTLRRYFASRGASLPISAFAEDYLPGDVVTYYRPQNSGSRDHIAIVADAIGPSGHPMIVHNRGWGPQMEDALFVDKITGHYRYTRLQDQIAVAVTVKKAFRKQLAGNSKSNTVKDTTHIRRRVKALRTILKSRQVAGRSAIKQ